MSRVRKDPTRQLTPAELDRNRKGWEASRKPPELRKSHVTRLTDSELRLIQGLRAAKGQAR